MSHQPGPPITGNEVLLRRAERLAWAAGQSRKIEDPRSMLLALSLRDQLAQVISELADGCAALTAEMTTSKLRQTATAAYGAMASNKRTRT